MAKDLICGMEVNENGAEFMTHIEHETYYFCSKACRDRFELSEGIVEEDADKGFFRRALNKILKEPAEKPRKCIHL
ncbi:MAG: YHS domain-containing protein [Deltaproteobacteria bacterium]|nr:YHS domain-containing protein [Deltaproteobacteria bacterium]